MSYDYRLLCERVTVSLQHKPGSSLRELSQELRVSRRTIQNAVSAALGKAFRDLREQLLVARIQTILLATPSVAIKELSYQVGYRSPQSFARAVRRVCGLSPEQLRARIAKELVPSESLA